MVVILIAIVVRIITVEDAKPTEAADVNETMIIKALERQDQVVLLRSSSLGIYEATNSRTIFGDKKLFGSEKVDHIQYSYTSKIGFDASDVKIESKWLNRYVITIPAFIVIGYDDLKFETVAKNGGFLSFATEDIDTASVISEIMTPEKLSEQIGDNQEMLEEEAVDFYTGIAEGLDDGIKVKLKFEFE